VKNEEASEMDGSADEEEEEEDADLDI